MEIRKSDKTNQYAKEDIVLMIRQLLFGALVISAVGVAAYFSLLLMMYFI